MKYTKPEIEIQKFDIIEDVAASEISSSIDIDDSGEIGTDDDTNAQGHKTGSAQHALHTLSAIVFGFFEERIYRLSGK